MSTFNPLDWLKLPPAILWGLLVACGLVLWAPPWFITGLGLQDFLKIYRIYLGVVFLVLLAATIPFLVISVAKIPIRYFVARQKTKVRMSRLKSLSAPEKALLMRFLAEETRSMTLDLTHPVVAALISIEVLYRAASFSQGGMRFACAIQPWAWDAIKADPALLL